MIFLFCFLILLRLSNAAPRSLDVQAFQVSVPLSNYGQPVFSQNIAFHVFVNSYNEPIPQFNYIPPNVSFSNVELTLVGSTYGRQFDRLSHIYVGDTEIWRPSTAEPRGGNVNWTYTKDVSEYVTLFRMPQNISIRLGNVVNSIYTGKITYNLTMSYFLIQDLQKTVLKSTQKQLFKATPSLRSQEFANNIISIGNGTLHTTSGNWSENLPSISRNTTSIVLEMFVSGNARDEFWYSNTLDEYSSLQTVSNAGLHGRAPSRVVQVYIDEELAGYAYPFPIIYTGGIAPQLWSPIVGISAFDVPSYRIDLTPFLPLLWESPSKIKFVISNGLDNSPVNNDWLFNAHLSTWEAEGIRGSGYRTSVTGSYTNSSAFGTPPDSSLFEIVRLKSEFRSQATLFFDGGDFDATTPVVVSWVQSANFSNYLSLTKNGELLDVAQRVQGFDSFSHNLTGTETNTTRSYSYPLVLTASGNENTSYTLITRALNTSLNNNSMITYENASAVVDTVNGTSFPRIYETEQWLRKQGEKADYAHHARAFLGELVLNQTGTSSLFPDSFITALDLSGNALDRLISNNHKRIRLLESEYGQLSSTSGPSGMLIKVL